MSEPRDKFKIIGLSISGMVVLVILVAWFLIWRGSRDIDAPDISDLEVDVLKVADEDNALTYIEKAANALKWDGSLVQAEDPEAVDLRGWLEGEVEIAPGKLRKTMEENQEVFAWLERAAACEHFVPPAMKPPFHTYWGYVKYMKLSDLIAAKARWHTQNKRYEDAANSLILGNKVALKVQFCGATYLDLVIGGSVSQAMMKEMLHMARHAGVPGSVVKTMADEIPNSDKLDAAFVEVVKTECHMSFQHIDYMLASDAGREALIELSVILDWPSGLEFLQGSFFGYRFHPNRTKQIFADHYRMYAFRLPDTYLEASKDGYLNERAWDLDWQDAMRPNALGYSLYGNSSIGSHMFEKLCAMKYQLDAHRVALEVLVHRKDYGGFPAKLEDLEGLESVPLDPYDGKPMRYDATRFIIYTVGKDLVDDPDARTAQRLELLDWDKVKAMAKEEELKRDSKRTQNE